MKKTSNLHSRYAIIGKRLANAHKADFNLNFKQFINTYIKLICNTFEILQFHLELALGPNADGQFNDVQINRLNHTISLLVRHHNVMKKYAENGIAKLQANENQAATQQNDDQPNNTLFVARIDRSRYRKIYNKGSYTFVRVCVRRFC